MNKSDRLLKKRLKRALRDMRKLGREQPAYSDAADIHQVAIMILHPDWRLPERHHQRRQAAVLRRAALRLPLCRARVTP